MENPVNLSEIVEQAHDTAREKGFWVNDSWGDKTILSQKLALIHSEVSEALEVLRHPSKNIVDFGEELADVVIRVADLAGFLRIDLDQMVSDKMKKNRDRPTRHGKAF